MPDSDLNHSVSENTAHINLFPHYEIIYPDKQIHLLNIAQCLLRTSV